MVAISLYRGNLHRVPDIPRKWLMPNHTISLKDFKSLTRKREKALSRFLSTTTTTIATTSNPNPNSNAEQQHKQNEFVGDSGSSKQKTIEPPPQCQTQTRTGGGGGGVNEIKIERVDDRERDPSLQQHRIVGDAKDHSGGSDGETQRKRIRDSISCPDNKSAVPPPSQTEIGGNDVGGVATLEAEKDEKQLTLAEPPPVEISNDVDLNDREKKKRELEENLKVLNERKHNLVQMLKQILNAEEEIKRRESLQASVVRPLAPQQVEAATDMGSNPKQAGNRMGPEANFSGDLEGESEDASNRQFHRMRSTSPSASSPLRKRAHSPLQHTAVPQSSQPGLGVSGNTQPTSAMFTGVASSPSRFAPAGHQGHPTSLPPLSVSGIHCSASSPSPAASGGTSVFRDARLTSPPWN